MLDRLNERMSVLGGSLRYCNKGSYLDLAEDQLLSFNRNQEMFIEQTNLE
jgi:hypothetical protein